MVLEPATVNILLGFGISILTILTTNGFQVWRDRLQSQRQQQLEGQRWERDKLLEIYTNCISNITAYLRSGRSVPPDPTRPGPATPFGAIAYNLELHGQAEAWLTLLLIYHPARESVEYTEFEAEVKSLDQTPAKLGQLLSKIVAIARTDARLLTPHN